MFFVPMQVIDTSDVHWNLYISVVDTEVLRSAATAINMMRTSKLTLQFIIKHGSAYLLNLRILNKSLSKKQFSFIEISYNTYMKPRSR